MPETPIPPSAPVIYFLADEWKDPVIHQYAPRPGRVLALSAAERRENEINDLVLDQRTACGALKVFLECVMAQIQSLEFPLGSPARGFDAEDFVSTLGDMKPTQTIAEMERRAEEIVNERWEADRAARED